MKQFVKVDFLETKSLKLNKFQNPATGGSNYLHVSTNLHFENNVRRQIII